MANSKYEYVKEVGYERECVVVPGNIIVVRLEFRDFRRFSELHEFERPNDMNAVGLMNCCARVVLEQFPDVFFSYGYRDEYSFVFKRGTKFYQRRASKILSLTVSFFTSMYVTKWKELFPEKDLRFAPSFLSRVICCPTLEILQAYLGWRQSECHSINQHDTCLWQLIKSGKSEKEAEAVLMVSQKQDRNELLFQSFKINYTKDVPLIFRQGTCTLNTEVEEVESRDDGGVVKRLRRKIITVHSKNIASRRFWNDQPCPVKELGQYTEDLNKPNPDYIKAFQLDCCFERCLASTYIVVRVDGCHFHRFSDVHEFEKPNDMQALNLMNSCAAGVLEEFKDIVFSYGDSDEYSFVLKKESRLYERRVSDIVSAIVSLFSSLYTRKWKEFFPDKEMKYTPYFDGRVACYPTENIRDYLAWRQVDCHINNQYNTCFWMLVKSGKSKSDAQKSLKGTQTQQKNILLDDLTGVSDYYSTLPLIFRNGSSVYWEKEKNVANSEEDSVCKTRKIVVVKYCNIIDASFWEAHPEILNEKVQLL